MISVDSLLDLVVVSGRVDDACGRGRSSSSWTLVFMSKSIETCDTFDKHLDEYRVIE